MSDSQNEESDKHQCIEHPDSSTEAVDETVNVTYEHPHTGKRGLHG